MQVKSVNGLQAQEALTALVAGKQVQIAAAAWKKNSSFRRIVYRLKKQFESAGFFYGVIESSPSLESKDLILLTWKNLDNPKHLTVEPNMCIVDNEEAIKSDNFKLVEMPLLIPGSEKVSDNCSECKGTGFINGGADFCPSCTKNE